MGVKFAKTPPPPPPDGAVKVETLKALSADVDKLAATGRKGDPTTALDRMVAAGDVVPRPEGYVADLTDPQLREEFGRMVYVGVPDSDIRRVLRISRAQLVQMRREHVEQAVEALSSTGVVGVVAMSFDKLEEAGRRAMQLAATADSPRLTIEALRLVKDLETSKIDLLVKTGAIKVKKKIEISGSLEHGTNPEQYEGERAQRVLLQLATMVVEEEDADFETVNAQAIAKVDKP
jgi:hypothetical protein